MIKQFWMLFLSALVLAGCAAESGIPRDQIWLEDRSMIRLEREVRELCEVLTKDMRPASVHFSWHDDRHPHSPLLAEAYVASMFKRSLIQQGFTLSQGHEAAVYQLDLVMTPVRKSLLALASLRHGGRVIATAEAHFIHGPEQWSRALCSHRCRTTVTIPIRSGP